MQLLSWLKYYAIKLRSNCRTFSMALEDFFTLTEMKDGLATVARVKELMSILRKQKHCTVVSIRDEAREWSTVAGILASTENKSCLDCFIQLDGLWFLNRWLVYSIDTVCGPVEETIRLILGALQKLPVNRDKYWKKLISSGIGRTIKQIVSLGNLKVHDSARILLEKWDFTRDEVEICQDEEEHEPCFDDEIKDDADMIEDGERSPSPVPEVPSKEETGRKSCKTDSTGNHGENLNEDKWTVCLEGGSGKDEVVSVQRTSSDSCDANPNSRDAKSKQRQMNAPTAMEISGASVGVTGATTNNPPLHEESNELPQKNASCMGSSEIKVDLDNTEGSQSELGKADALSFVEDSLKEKIEDNLGLEKAESDQVDGHKPQESSHLVNCRIQDFNGISKEHNLGKTEDVKSSFQGLKILGTCNDTKKSERFLRASKRLHSRRRQVMKSTIGTNSTSELNKIKSDIAFEYGDDALEVAVQVALEAKLEVADREGHSSSDDDISEDETVDSSISGSESNQLETGKSRAKIDQSESGNSEEAHSFKQSENINIDSKSLKDDEQEKTSVGKSPQNTEKSKCNFDLNVCTEEIDYLPPLSVYQNNLSTPVAVVPTRGTHGLPVAPLHFEGELGWRGSAATSAFRPASPRSADGERTVSGPKQKASFDLNVVDCENDAATDIMLEKQIQVSSVLPLYDSSVEVTSAKAERLKLDLNRLDDDSTFYNSSSSWKFHHANGSTSPASSSNSKQMSMRDIDLNDNPLFFDSFGPNKDRGAADTAVHGGFKLNDPYVTIMGSKLSIERKEPISQSQLPFLARRPEIASTMYARPTTYPHAPAAGYAYLPHSFYGSGSFPYMVDARGTPVLPQMLGSSGTLHAPSSRPPFLVNVSGAQSGLGAVGSSLSGLDLNAVSTSFDGGNKEMGKLKQLIMNGQNGVTEEQIQHPSQTPPASSMGIKRKEPDCGWETYPIGYKQVTSWQ